MEILAVYASVSMGIMVIMVWHGNVLCITAHLWGIHHSLWKFYVIARGWGYSLCDGWYICAAVLTPFFHFGRIEHDLFGVFFSSTNSKAIIWGTKTTNFYKNRSFWPQIQFFPRSFWVQFSAASGTPPSVFRPSTPPPGVIGRITRWYPAKRALPAMLTHGR